MEKNGKNKNHLKLVPEPKESDGVELSMSEQDELNRAEKTHPANKNILKNPMDMDYDEAVNSLNESDRNLLKSAYEEVYEKNEAKILEMKEYSIDYHNQTIKEVVAIIGECAKYIHSINQGRGFFKNPIKPENILDVLNDYFEKRIKNYNEKYQEHMKSEMLAREYLGIDDNTAKYAINKSEDNVLFVDFNNGEHKQKYSYSDESGLGGDVIDFKPSKTEDDN